MKPKTTGKNGRHKTRLGRSPSHHIEGKVDVVDSGCRTDGKEMEQPKIRADALEIDQREPKHEPVRTGMERVLLSEDMFPPLGFVPQNKIDWPVNQVGGEDDKLRMTSSKTPPPAQ